MLKSGERSAGFTQSLHIARHLYLLTAQRRGDRPVTAGLDFEVRSQKRRELMH